MAPEESALRRTWAEAFPRYLTILDELFDRALEGCEFEFIHSLLGIRDYREAGWDPWDTTEALLETMERLINITEDQPTRRHLKLWTWGHVVEADEPYEFLRNLIAIAGGGTFLMGRRWFPDIGTESKARPQYPAAKTDQLDKAARGIGLPRLVEPLREILHRELRNAVFHADYVLHGSEVKLPRTGLTLDHDTVEDLTIRAGAYLGALIILRRHYVSTYTEPNDLTRRVDGLRYTVVVREGYGAVGLKAAATGPVWEPRRPRFFLGRVTPEEMDFLNEDFTRALLPPLPGARRLVDGL
jgi:hypothetical protein